MSTDRAEVLRLLPVDLSRTPLSRDEAEEFVAELRRGSEFFRERVKALNPRRDAVVLDAACGIGTWSVAISAMARSVVGIDISVTRIRIADSLRASSGASGLAFAQGDLHHLPFRDGVFDVVICSGALMFVRSRHVVKELVRVLKPGGVIYASMNGIGWAAIELPRRAVVRRRLVLAKGAVWVVGRTAYKWITGQDITHTAFRRKEVVRLLEANGVRVECVADEGRGMVAGADAKPRPAYKGRYGGLNGIFEVFGRKCDIS